MDRFMEPGLSYPRTAMEVPLETVYDLHGAPSPEVPSGIETVLPNEIRTCEDSDNSTRFESSFEQVAQDSKSVLQEVGSHKDR